MEQKVTLITTVKNEEYTIKEFFDSILVQTKKPDEIVVVDGGSTDKTVEIIKNHPLKILLLKKTGNRSVGRNEAIKLAKNNIIAVSDVGCILDKNWLEKITEPFGNEKIDVVAGFYKPKTNSIFEKCLSTYTCTMPDKLDKKNFLPSSRSVAFRKTAWKKVNGYPEYLDTCEDLIFDKKLKQKGLGFITQEKAIVYWPQRKNIFQAARQFYSYAKGDGRARFIRKNTYFLFLRYFLGVIFLAFILSTNSSELSTVLIVLFLMYLLWAIIKNYKYVSDFRAILYLPLLQLVSDIAVILGTAIGLIL